MGMPKSIIKIKKNGVEYVSNVDRCAYTIRELTFAALYDVAKLLRTKLRVEAKSLGLKGRRVYSAWQYWVRKRDADMQIGTKAKTWYGADQEKGANKVKNVKSHIREELRSKMRYAHKGDVIIVGAGENNIDIGVGVAWEGEEDVAVHDACYTLVHEQNSKYIAYYLRSDMYHSQIKKYVSSGKICSISASGLGKAKIPIPSLEEQQRIVEILERFDVLCNNISSGIPAEIEARKKQYEYYRDKLLSFKELEKVE